MANPKSPEQRILDTVDELVALSGWTTPDKIQKLGKKTKRLVKKALQDERLQQHEMAMRLSKIKQEISVLISPIIPQ